jgi:hypothetical protein
VSLIGFGVICRIYEVILCHLPNLWGDFVSIAEFMRIILSFAEFVRQFCVICRIDEAILCHLPNL